MKYGAIWDNKTFNDLSENFDMNKNELLIMREKVGVEKSRFNIAGLLGLSLVSMCNRKLHSPVITNFFAKCLRQFFIQTNLHALLSNSE